MKVKPKDLLFSSLPSARDKKKLMKAQLGKQLGETGMSPLNLQSMPGDYFDQFKTLPVQGAPNPPYGSPDTSKIKPPPVPLKPPGVQPPPQEPQPRGGNIGEALMYGLSAFDALLPNQYNRQTVVQPQMGYNPYLYGTGSQAIANYGGYIKDDGNTPSAQSGGRVPIYTNDPNDPRLQAYQDSMTLYNANRGDIARLKRMDDQQWMNYVKKWDKLHPEAFPAYERLRALNGRYPLPIETYSPSEGNQAVAYKKPVYPVVYQAERDIPATAVSSADMTTLNGVTTTRALPDLSQKPTKYSVTVRDDSAPNKQRSIYFKDKKSWRDFVDSGAVSTTSTSEMEDSATAAGYRTMQQGGKLPPIRTYDKNDPRLKAYRDSLGLSKSNFSIGFGEHLYDNIDDLKKNFKGDALRFGYYRNGEFIDHIGQYLGGIQPVDYADWDHNREKFVDLPYTNILYKEPIQPVELAQRRPVHPSQVEGVGYNQTRGEVSPSGKFSDLSQKPTKYSVTIRDENSPNKQRSIYFKDKKSWRDFMDSGAVNTTSSTEMEDSATAAGYPTMASGGWIQKAINPAHKGYCTPMTKSTCTPRRKALAKTLKKLAKRRKNEGGGIIPDNMSVFNPHRYEHGGNVNGGANIHMVGGKYPNADLLEQWLLYRSGGPVNWTGKEFHEVPGNYPNTDLLEQWIQYGEGGPVYQQGGDIPTPPNLLPPKGPQRDAYLDSLSSRRTHLANEYQVYIDRLKEIRAEEAAEDALPLFQRKWTKRHYFDQRMRLGQRFMPVYQDLISTSDQLQQASNPLTLYKPEDTVKPPKKGKNGMNVEREFRSVSGVYPNSDLLEQWLQYRGGGPVNNTGYLDGAPTSSNPYNIIPGGDISMQGVSQPIMARPMQGGSLGEEIMMMPGQNYAFNADSVMEYPLRAGGQLSADKAREMLRDGTANGKKLTKKQRQYFGMVAAGKAQTGTMVSNTNPEPTPSPQERYYQASARLGHFKNILNDRLKKKNPQGFTDYFGGLTNLRRSGKAADAEKYVQETPYEDYLSPEEVQSTLSPEDYNDYIGALQDVNSYNVQQGRQPLFGTKENPGDIRALNYGRRFASLQLTPSLGVGSATRNYNRDYNYDPSTRQVSFSERGDLSLRPDYLSAPPTTSMRKGGVVYDDGGEVGTLWGGNSELASYNPYDGGMIEFEGASHEDGGIGMHYNGKPVEVEGGEFASKDAGGNLNIYGNMVLPGTKTKFKSVAKEIADKEREYDRLRTTGSTLVNSANPADKYERLKFNAGAVMMEGGKMGQMDLTQKKENLSALQKAMLDTASEFGLEPEAFSKGVKKKARKGSQITYQSGGAVTDPTMADRNNNPGNIKWGEFARKMGARKGPPAADGGYFAVFPSRESGDKAMRALLKTPTYKNLTIDQAIEKWTGGKPYNYNLDALGTGRKVSELSPEEFNAVVSTMQRGEGTRYPMTGSVPQRDIPARPAVPAPPTYTPYDLPVAPPFSQDPQRPVRPPVNPPNDTLQVPPDRGPIPSDVEPLHANQLLGEIYAAATNRVEPVPAQRYDPQLFQPFQVSFQDRLNQNQSSFSALQRSLGDNNPSALGALAAQKYQADSAVKADEFRTNQAISNEVTNKNVSLLNDAELKNLAIADQQMVRQSEARSKTRQLNQMILNSLSSKFAQNQYENKRLAAYENLYDYRFVPQKDGGLKATHYGPNALFNFSGNSNPGNGTDVRTVTRYDQYGNVKGVTEYDDYDLREMQREVDLEMKRRKLPLMSVPKLDK